MSDFQVSPVIIERIRSIGEELGELDELAQLLNIESEESWTNACAERVESIAGTSINVLSLAGLAETPRAGNPWLLAAALEHLANRAEPAQAAFAGASCNLSHAEGLAVQWLGLRLSDLGKTARYLSETVQEEAPPLPQN